MSLTICIGILVFVFLLEKGITTKEIESSKVKKVKIQLQNFLLMQFYNSYADIVLFSILDLSTVKFDSLLASVSFNLGFFITFAGMIILILRVLLLRRYQKAKNQSVASESEGGAIQEFNKHHEGVQVLFFSFRDTSIITQGFFLLLTLRNVVYSIIVALLYKYTLLQLILMLCLSIAMIGYLAFIRPFKGPVNLIQQLVGEVILLVVNGCLFSIYIISKKRPDLSGVQEKLNELIILNIILVGFISPVSLSIKITVVAIKLYKARREHRKQKQLNKAGESLEDQARKRQQKENEGQDQRKDKRLSVKQNMLVKVKAPRSLFNEPIQVITKVDIKNELVDNEHLYPGSLNLQRPALQQQNLRALSRFSSIDKSIRQQAMEEVKEEAINKDEVVYNEVSVLDGKHDPDVSSTNFRLNISDLDIDSSSVEVQKTRWLNQRGRLSKVRQNIGR